MSSKLLCLCLAVPTLTLLTSAGSLAQQPKTFYTPTAGSGLTLSISAGASFCGKTLVSYPGGTLRVTGSAGGTTNYVYLDRAAQCAPASSASGFHSSAVPLALVVANKAMITSVRLLAKWFPVALAAPRESSEAGPQKTADELVPDPTQNYIPVFTDSSGTLGNSVMYQSTGGSIGIGTATPDALLSVNGVINIADKGALLAAGGIVDNLQYRSNYRASTGLEWDTGKPSWALGLGGSGTDEFQLLRAPASVSAPSYTGVLLVDSNGNLFAGNGGNTAEGVIRAGKGTAGSASIEAYSVLDNIENPLNFERVRMAVGFSSGAGANMSAIISDAEGTGTARPLIFRIGSTATPLYMDTVGSLGVNTSGVTNGAVTINASGANQNVALTPSGTGYTLLGGNVGIGTTAPSNLLTVQGASPQVSIQNGSSPSSYYATLGSNFNYSNPFSLLVAGGNAGDPVELIGAHYSNGRATALMYGNVGIGTSSPALQLQVAKAMGGGVNVATGGTTVTFDASLGNTQKLTLNSATTGDLTGCQSGQWLVFDIIGDGNSLHTFSWGTIFKGGTNITGAPQTNSGEHNRQTFYCDGTYAWR